jgi:hypothetical protein
MYGRPSLTELASLLWTADLTISTDSGPLHLSRLMGRPTLGTWVGQHHPSQFSVPHPKLLNLDESNGAARHPATCLDWNILRVPKITADNLFNATMAMLENRSYPDAAWRALDDLLISRRPEKFRFDDFSPRLVVASFSKNDQLLSVAAWSRRHGCPLTIAGPKTDYRFHPSTYLPVVDADTEIEILA